MIIRNSLKILNEISEIEKLITHVENAIRNNNLDVDDEAVIKDILDKTDC
jgi:anti-sigma28 factor (negative regulator of flagellin synthesis)